MTQPDKDLLTLEDLTLDDNRAARGDDLVESGFGVPLARDPEAPDADALEQATPVDPSEAQAMPSIPFEADEADAYDQFRVVQSDEDDYR
jgi:hypothetical protein